MTQISNLVDWRIETKKLEGAGLEKEGDKCILEHTEFEFWMAFQLGCSACKTGALEKYQHW